MKYIKLFENVKKRMVVALVPDEYYVGYVGDDMKVVTKETLPENRRKDYDGMKFHIGDIVYYRPKNDTSNNDAYIIDAVELPYDGILNYHIDNDNDCLWTSEKSLISDFEADAEKYNL